MPPTSRLYKGRHIAERRALAGELLDLEATWRAEEVVAQIADDFLVPQEVEEDMARLKAPREPDA